MSSIQGPGAILARLVHHDVDFIVIGGLAAIAHGSRRLTRDIDIVVNPQDANLARLEAALCELGARALGPEATERAIEPADVATVALGTTLHTSTVSGRLDVIGAPAGAADYPKLRERSIEIHVAGSSVRVAGLDDLIAMKRACGRPLDLQDIADLTSHGSPPGL